MYTQCPECKTQRTISAEELRTSRGMVNCNQCSSMFDALELLNDGQVKGKQESLPLTNVTKKSISAWSIAYTFCIILFIFQIVVFEGYNLTQNSTVRPWLVKICQYSDCQLPLYKNLNEFTIMHGAFELTENGHYLFKTAFINQSDFEQNHPSIKLTLQNFNGADFAERVFHSKDYSKQTLGLIKPDMSAEVTLKIAAPSSKIGGYRFELI